MEPVAIITILILGQYFYFSILVGRARMQHQVMAPAVTGNAFFERCFRVQQNTMEQLIIFLPCMWLFGMFVSPMIAAGLGLLFMIGRQFYCIDYIADPAKRARGFVIGQLAQTVALLGALIGAVLSWL